MALFDAIFYMFAFIVVVSAMGVVFSRKMMYSAFSLLFTFFGVAGLYVLLNADFIAITQIMVYVGGILVLIIFGVMLTTKLTGVDIKSGTLGKVQLGTAALVCVSMLTMLCTMYSSVNWMLKPSSPTDATINAIGTMLYTDYLLAVMSAAVLLLVAFIGAAYIARRQK